MEHNSNKVIDEKNFVLKINDRALKYFSKKELEIITSKTIAIAGIGGVGAIAVELIARWGIKKFRLLDMDKYDLSNVNRQIFATTETIGSLKAKVAAERIKKINPYCEVEMVICERLTKETATKLVKGADIVLMETDTTSSTLLLHKIARKYKVPLINGHCYQVVKGKVHIFDYRNLKQRDFDEPTPFKSLNAFAQKFFNLTRKPFDEMSENDIMQLDRNLFSYPAVNFTTNIVGCLVVAETIKFFINDGSNCLHPKEIDIDLFKRKMRVSSAFSIKYSLDFIVRHWDQISSFLKWSIIKKV